MSKRSKNLSKRQKKSMFPDMLERKTSRHPIPDNLEEEIVNIRPKEVEANPEASNNIGHAQETLRAEIAEPTLAEWHCFKVEFR